jgi:hypothetical protein
MVICPEAISAQNSMAAVSALGSALGLDPALELLMQALDGIGGAQGFPLLGRIAEKGEQPLSVQPLRGMGQQVTLLVHRATLHQNVGV